MKIKNNKVSYREQQQNHNLSDYFENNPLKEEKGSNIAKKEESGVEEG